MTNTYNWAWVVSILLHPLWLPFLLLAFLLYGLEIDAHWSDASLRKVILELAFWAWVVFPLLWLLLLKQLGLIRSWHMPHAKERRIPLALFLLIYAVSVWASFYLSLDNSIRILSAGVAAALLLALMINEYYKISLHTLSLGGSSAFMACILIGNYAQKATLIVLGLGLCLIVSIVVYAARLHLRAHTAWQLWMGYLVGSLSMGVSYGLLQ